VKGHKHLGSLGSDAKIVRPTEKRIKEFNIVIGVARTATIGVRLSFTSERNEWVEWNR
jgi:hypothetical protein